MVFALKDIVGPKIPGNEPFDSHCFYGNNMWLTEHQVHFLEGYTEDYDPNDPFKIYVYKMSSSTVIPEKSMMVI
jgi:hypothetical protein